MIKALMNAAILVVDKEFLLTTHTLAHPALNDILLGIIAEIFQRHYAIMNIVAKKPTERLKGTLLFFSCRACEEKIGLNEVLKNISIKVSIGKLVLLIGSNGARKTTLLNTIGG